MALFAEGTPLATGTAVMVLALYVAVAAISAFAISQPSPQDQRNNRHPDRRRK